MSKLSLNFRLSKFRTLLTTNREADSLDIAREVENYFLNEYPEQESKRMKGGTGGDISQKKAVFVCSKPIKYKNYRQENCKIN